jgi:hypothetical protein
MMVRFLESNNTMRALVIILKCLPPKITTNIKQIIATLLRSNPRGTNGNS